MGTEKGGGGRNRLGNGLCSASTIAGGYLMMSGYKTVMLILIKLF